MSFWEKVKEFFSEPEYDPSTAGEPVEFEGKTFKPWDPKEDQYVQWPNATCAICNGLQLKTKLYYNKETETYCHKECLLKGAKK